MRRLSKKADNQTILILLALFLGGIFFIREMQSVTEYNEFCESTPFSSYCICGQTDVTGGYSVPELGGEPHRFHEDVWVQTHLATPKIVSCMRGRIQLIAECPGGVQSSASGSYECVPEVIPPEPTTTVETGGSSAFTYLLIGVFALIVVVVLIILRK